mmetsp:Transcript_25866/g.46789  ORF Transcript_25866/g.46789 Transcript_25866/m.46789 type:complete len:229 (+) Transcript_25866:57-743(+)
MPRAKKAVGRPSRVSSQGQHLPSGTGCIATSVSGKPCLDPRASKNMPYCSRCMKTGDPSLKVTKHPHFGKILVANRKLRKGYYVSWWGKLLKRKSDMPSKHMEWALETTKGMIDAVPYKGSMLQFCACPGPSEVPVIDFAPASDILLKKGQDMGAVIFRTLRDIPKGYQVDMMYNKDEKTTDEFFKEQGIERGDVGTKSYPALKKSKAQLAKLKSKNRAATEKMKVKK